MTTDQTSFSPAELLRSHDYAEPLVANGVRCHGGFDGDGRYVSPRTRHRSAAIAAWQDRHRRLFGTEILEVPLDQWPGPYPNVAQAKHLIRNGVREPVVATLTRIGTVEAFGAMLRLSAVPPLPGRFEEDVAGTALAHLTGGLFEAHARDEAGAGDEAGHDRMWFAARDIAFESPLTEDQTALMLERMGLRGPGGAPADFAALRRAAMERRVSPDDIPYELEETAERMARILLVEVQAFHTFAWAEEVLSDNALVAGSGEAARLVSYIRADETPHVEYLRTALTELRDRTWVGDSGRRYPGTSIIGPLWDRAVAESLGPRRRQTVRWAREQVEESLAGHPRAASILAEFHALGPAPHEAAA